MGYRGRRGRYPGNGPFRDLPPYKRPGWLHGFGRGMGYGGGYGRSSSYTSPYNCAKFPWLPRRWWADPKYESSKLYPLAPDTGAELERLQAERTSLERSIEEMERHVKAGTTPAIWPVQHLPYYGMGTYTSEQEKNLLEEQMRVISSQMEAIKKRLKEIKEGD